jgi:hypothetical protein
MGMTDTDTIVFRLTLSKRRALRAVALGLVRAMIERAKVAVRVLWPQHSKPPSDGVVNTVALIAAAFASQEVARALREAKEPNPASTSGDAG